MSEAERRTLAGTQALGPGTPAPDFALPAAPDRTIGARDLAWPDYVPVGGLRRRRRGA